MGLAEKLLDAKVFETGARLGLGKYTASVKNLIHREVTTNAGECLIAELTLEDSTNPDHPVGATRGLVFQMGTALGLSLAKSFLYAAMGARNADERGQADGAIKKAIAPTLVSQGSYNGLNGRKVHVEVVPHVNKQGENVTKTLVTSV